MDIETIKIIVQYGLLGILALVFLFGFLVGLIKGRYKVLTRFSFVIIYMVLMLFLTPPIINGLLNISVPINSEVISVKGYIDNFIATNPQVQEILTAMPSLETIAYELVVAIISPIMYVIFVWIGLIVVSPIYLGYTFIVKAIFKRPKFEKDENGNIVRDMSNKKIRIKYKKHRLSAAFIRGFQAVLVFSVVLMPLNLITRLYNYAKTEEGAVAGETLCDTITGIEDYSVYCQYIEIYTEGLSGKIGGANFIDAAMFRTLTRMSVNDDKFNIESELKTLIKAVVSLENSGIIELAMNSNDMENLDLSTLDSTKIEGAINALMESKIFSNIVVDGVNYALTLAAHELANALNAPDLVLNLTYDRATLLSDINALTTILSVAIDNNFLSLINIDTSNLDLDEIKSVVTKSSLETIVSSLLDMKILQELYPHILYGLLQDYGAVLPSSVTFANEKEIFMDIIDLLYSITTIDPNELLNTVSSAQIALIGEIIDDVLASSIIGNVIPTVLDDLLVENLPNFDFDTTLITSTTWEDEFSAIGDSVAYLRDAGIFDLFTDPNFDIATIDASTIDFDDVKSALSAIMQTDTISTILTDGVNFASDNYMSNLEEGLGISSSNITLEYTKASLENDLLNIVDVMEIVLTNNLYSILDSEDGLTTMKTVNESVYDSLIDEVLDTSFITAILPSLIYEYMQDYGVVIPTTTIDWNVESQILKNIVSIVYAVNDFSDVSAVLLDLDSTTIDLIGNTLDSLDNSAIFGDVIATTVPMFVDGLIDGVTLTSADLEAVSSWSDELNILKNLYTAYSNYDGDGSIDYALIGQTIDLIISSDLIIKFMPGVINMVMPTIDPSFVLPTNIDWVDELTLYKTIFLNMEDIGDLGSIDLNLLSNQVERDALGNMLDAAFDSQVLGAFISNMMLDILNPMLQEFSIELTIADISNVNDWGMELETINTLYTDFMVDDGSGGSLFNLDTIDSSTISTLLDAIEDLQILTNYRVEILVTAIEFAGFMNQSELDALHAIDLSTVSYSNEKDIMLAIFNYSSVMTNLDTLDFATMNSNDLGTILNYIYGKQDPLLGESILLKDYMSNKLLGLMPTNITIDQQDLEDVPNWISELSIISSIFNSSYDIENITSFDIATMDTNEVGTLLNNALDSSLLADDVANEISTLLTSNNIDATPGDVIAISDWTVELGLLSSILNSSYDFDNITSFDIATMDTNEVGTLLNNAFDSELLADSVATDVVTLLTSNNINATTGDVIAISDWTVELGLLSSILNSSYDFDNITSLDIATMDTNEVGTLLNNALDSSLLADSVATDVVTLMADNNVIVTPAEVIAVDDWVNELAILQDLATVDNSITPAELETLLTSVDTSSLMQPSEWALLDDVIDALGLPYTPDPLNGWANEVSNIVTMYASI